MTGPQPTPTSVPRLWPWHALLFGAGLAYATLRYNVWGTTPVAAWPLFIVNKAVSIHAIGALGMVLRAQRRHDGRLAGLWRNGLQASVMLHVVLSLLVLQPAYLAKLFTNGQYTGQAGVSLLMGALAAGLWVHAPLRKAVGTPRAFVWGTLLLVVHVATLGGMAWLRPETWPALLPPITLLCTGALVGMLARWPKS